MSAVLADNKNFIDSLNEFAKETLGLGEPVVSATTPLRPNKSGTNYFLDSNNKAYVGNYPVEVREKLVIGDEQCRVDLSMGMGSPVSRVRDSLIENYITPAKLSWAYSNKDEFYDYLSDLIDTMTEFYNTFSSSHIAPFLYTDFSVRNVDGRFFADFKFYIGSNDKALIVEYSDWNIFTHSVTNIAPTQLRKIAESAVILADCVSGSDVLHPYIFGTSEHNYQTVLLNTLARGFGVKSVSETFEGYTRLMNRNKQFVDKHGRGGIPPEVKWDSLSKEQKNYLSVLTNAAVSGFSAVLSSNSLANKQMS